MRYCNGCKTDKEVTEFTVDKSRSSGLNYQCKSCINKRKRSYHTASHSDKKVYQMYLWHTSNSYGLCEQDIRDLEDKQRGCCPICLRSLDCKGVFHIDHDHKDGNVRGLLCRTCNVGLGHFEDNHLYLERAARYVH